MSVEFTYKLTGSGWAEAIISDDTQRLPITVSYLNNPLYDLLTGLRGILVNQETTCEVYFFDEPGEYKMTISRVADREIQLSIQWVDDWLTNQKDKAMSYKLLFQTISNLRAFASNIVTALEELLQVEGEKGYNDKWVSDPFPIKELKELKQCLRREPL